MVVFISSVLFLSSTRLKGDVALETCGVTQSQGLCSVTVHPLTGLGGTR